MKASLSHFFDVDKWTKKSKVILFVLFVLSLVCVLTFHFGSYNTEYNPIVTLDEIQSFYVNDSQNMLIADKSGERILNIGNDSVVWSISGQKDNTPFKKVYDLIEDDDKNIYFITEAKDSVDTNHECIIMYDKDGRYEKNIYSSSDEEISIAFEHTLGINIIDSCLKWAFVGKDYVKAYSYDLRDDSLSSEKVAFKDAEYDVLDAAFTQDGECLVMCRNGDIRNIKNQSDTLYNVLSSGEMITVPDDIEIDTSDNIYLFNTTRQTIDKINLQDKTSQIVTETPDELMSGQALKRYDVLGTVEGDTLYVNSTSEIYMKNTETSEEIIKSQFIYSLANIVIMLLMYLSVLVLLFCLFVTLKAFAKEQLTGYLRAWYKHINVAIVLSAVVVASVAFIFIFVLPETTSILTSEYQNSTFMALGAAKEDKDFGIAENLSNESKAYIEDYKTIEAKLNNYASTLSDDPLFAYCALYKEYDGELYNLARSNNYTPLLSPMKNSQNTDIIKTAFLEGEESEKTTSQEEDEEEPYEFVNLDTIKLTYSDDSDSWTCYATPLTNDNGDIYAYFEIGVSDNLVDNFLSGQYVQIIFYVFVLLAIVLLIAPEIFSFLTARREQQSPLTTSRYMRLFVLIMYIAMYAQLAFVALTLRYNPDIIPGMGNGYLMFLPAGLFFLFFAITNIMAPRIAKLRSFGYVVKISAAASVLPFCIMAISQEFSNLCICEALFGIAIGIVEVGNKLFLANYEKSLNVKEAIGINKGNVAVGIITGAALGYLVYTTISCMVYGIISIVILVSVAIVFSIILKNDIYSRFQENKTFLALRQQARQSKPLQSGNRLGGILLYFILPLLYIVSAFIVASFVLIYVNAWEPSIQGVLYPRDVVFLSFIIIQIVDIAITKKCKKTFVPMMISLILLFGVYFASICFFSIGSLESLLGYAGIFIFLNFSLKCIERYIVDTIVSSDDELVDISEKISVIEPLVKALTLVIGFVFFSEFLTLISVFSCVCTLFIILVLFVNEKYIKAKKKKREKKFIKVFAILLASLLLLLNIADITYISVTSTIGEKASALNAWVTSEYDALSYTCAHGNSVATVDSSSKRFIMSQNEETTHYVTSDSHNDFINIYTVDMDNENVFFSNYYKDENGSIYRERIVSYNLNDTYFSEPIVLCEYERDNGDIIYPTKQLYALTAFDDTVNWISVDDDYITVCSYDKDCETTNSYAVCYPNMRKAITDATFNSDKELVILNKYGNISVLRDNTFETLFDASSSDSEELYLPTMICADIDGGILFNSSRTGDILKVDKNKSVSTAFKNDYIFTNDEDIETVFYNDITVNDKGNIYVSRDNGYSVIYRNLYDSEISVSTQDEICEFCNVLTLEILVSVMIPVVTILSLITVLIILLDRKIAKDIRQYEKDGGAALKKRKKALERRMVISAIIILTTLLIFSIFIPTLSNHSLDSLEGSVQSTLEVMKNGIPKKCIDLIDNFSKPDQLNSKDFDDTVNYLDSFLYSFQGGGIDTYYSLYSVDADGQCSTLLIDRTNATAPMTVYKVRDGQYASNDGYIHSIENGEMIAKQVSDSSGSYIFEYVSIRNENGEIIGVLELGADLDNFNEKMNSEILQSMLQIIIFLFIMLIVIKEISRFKQDEQRKLRKWTGTASVSTIRIMALLFNFAVYVDNVFLLLVSERIYQPIPGIPYDIAYMLPLSIEAAFAGVGAIFAPRLAKNMTLKKIMTLTMLVIIAGFCICASTPSFYVLLFGKVITGFGKGAASFALRCMCAEQSEEDSDRAYNELNNGLLSGAQIAITLGVSIYNRIEYRGTYLVTAVMMGLALLLFMKNSVHIKTASSDDEAPKEVSKISTLKFLANPSVLVFFAAVMLPCMIYMVLANDYMVIIGENFSLTEDNVSQILFFSLLVSIYTGPVLFKALSKRLDSSKIIVIMLSLVSLSCFLLYLYPSTWMLIIFAVVFSGVIVGLCDTVTDVHFEKMKAVGLYGYSKSVACFEVISAVNETISPMILGAVLSSNMKNGLLVLTFVFVASSAVFFLFSSFSTLRERFQKSFSKSR